MGVRKRAIVGAGLTVGVAAAVAFSLYPAAGPSRSPSQKVASDARMDERDHFGAMNLQIAYGSTPEQVLHQIGSPAKVKSGCWLYSGRVGSIRGRYSGPYIDAMKFCFGAGPTGTRVVTRILSHMATHTIVRRDPRTHKIVSKQTYRAGWGGPITILQPPPWYFQQNS
jgi:hypothetical protein